MLRYVLLFVLSAAFFSSQALAAIDDGPPVSITSPDQATTFAYGSIKSRVLFWNKRAQCLTVRVVFTDAQQNSGQPNDDSHDFNLPGITFDETKGVFYATSKKGQMIPVAHVKKVLFIKSVEATPNAAVRIQRLSGHVTVILEAIRPDDPAMKPVPSDPDGSHKVDVDKILN